jgi:hypothetical protein
MNDSVWEKRVLWWLKSKISLYGKVLRNIFIPQLTGILDFFLTPSPDSNDGGSLLDVD